MEIIFLYYNESIKFVNLPKLETVGRDFLSENKSAKFINIPLLNKAGIYFMYALNNVDEINIPYIKELKKASPLLNDNMN